MFSWILVLGLSATLNVGGNYSSFLPPLNPKPKDVELSLQS